MVQFHTINLNNVQLHYGEAAGPGPVLVILHGLTGSKDEFLHQVPQLARQAHVYLLDLRGHGRSGWANNAYQIADYGRDVAAFLRQVVGRPAVVLGHSLGGATTVWLAAHQPELFQGVLLEDPPLYILEMPRAREALFYDYFMQLRIHLRQHQAGNGSLEALVRYVGQMPVDENQTWLDVAGLEAVQERALQLHQLDPDTLNPMEAGSLLGHETSDHLLAQIRCPVHLVAARPEPGSALSAEDLQRALAHMPHASHAVIDEAGHDIHLDQPEAFLREVRPFLLQFQREQNALSSE